MNQYPVTEKENINSRSNSNPNQGGFNKKKCVVQRNSTRGKNKGYNLIGIEEKRRVVRMEVDYERNIIISRK